MTTPTLTELAATIAAMPASTRCEIDWLLEHAPRDCLRLAAVDAKRAEFVVGLIRLGWETGKGTEGTK
jgi:hypothetical protein